MKQKQKIIMAILLSAVSVGASALTVISTIAPTYPIGPYLTQSMSIATEAEATANQMALSKDSLAASIAENEPVDMDPHDNLQNLYSRIFPFAPQGMTVGRVKARATNLHLATPIFLVGSDDTSTAWLEKYKTKLIACHAEGFLIEANDVDAVAKMQKMAGSLPLSILPDSSIGSVVGVQHYPVLISAHFIEQ
jgi:integrating conjugative element protein (TIGR03765 family)